MDAVLDGTVQRAGKMIRVSVQLLRVADGTTLWAEHFDDYFTNVFQVQDSVSEKVSSALSMKLTAIEHRRMAKRQTENTQAYELYMHGTYLEFRRTADATAEKFIQLYRQAIAKDPDYALAYTGLARIYMEVAGMEGTAKPLAKLKTRPDARFRWTTNYRTPIWRKAR